MPFAHTPWTPQSRSGENKCMSPYYYFDDHWKGLRRTHWISGSCVIDYGTATVLPSMTLNIDEAFHYHKLNHDQEFSSPAYYRMNLEESGLLIEATAESRAGTHFYNCSFTFLCTVIAMTL